MAPLISVIVPVYNGQDYLAKCIESIETQTYQNLEIIIVNDGSTDQTAAVSSGLARRCGNIKVLTTNDEGVSKARNAGIDRADGEYIAFVDADDRLLPEMIRSLYESLIKTGSSIAGCGFSEWKTEDEWKIVCEKMPSDSSFMEKSNRYSAVEFLRDGILKGNSRCWSKLYRRSVIGDIRFRENITIGEDMLFLIDLLQSVDQVVEISYKGYGYFQNPKGAMNRAFLPKYMDQITCWEIAREEIRKMNILTEQKKQQMQLESQVTSILLMALMLTVGKLALLKAGERKKLRSYVIICHENVKKELQVPGAYEGLSRGYKIKARLFQRMPFFYLWLYHFRKYKK